MGNVFDELGNWLQGVLSVIPHRITPPVTSTNIPPSVLQQTPSILNSGPAGLHIPNPIGDATNGINQAEQNLQNYITTEQTTIYNEVKQGAIWAVLILVLVIGLLGLIMPSGENEVPIVVPA